LHRFSQLSTGGSVDTCEIEFTRQSEAFIVFDCQVDVDCAYPLASLQQGMKALGVAKVLRCVSCKFMQCAIVFKAFRVCLSRPRRRSFV
jgi:hypothetical protein